MGGVGVRPVHRPRDGRSLAQRTHQGLLCQFGPQQRDLRLQYVVLAFFAGKERLGQPQPLMHPVRRQHIQIASLVLAALKVLCLDPSFFEQSLKQVVSLAKAYAKRVGHLPLRIFRMTFEQPE